MVDRVFVSISASSRFVMRLTTTLICMSLAELCTGQLSSCSISSVLQTADVLIDEKTKAQVVGGIAKELEAHRDMPSIVFQNQV